MELRRYLRVLLSRKWAVLITVEVALLVAALISLTTTPSYSASATVRVAEGAAGATSALDVTYTERIVQTYVHLLTTRPFLDNTISRLRLPINANRLAGQIKISALPNTELISVGVNSADPQQAAAVANTLAALLVEQGQKVYGGTGKSTVEILQEQLNAAENQLRDDRATLSRLSDLSPVLQANTQTSPEVADLMTKVDAEQRTYATLLDQYDRARIDDAVRASSVSIVEPAVVPSSPSKPRVTLNVILGGLLGLIGGLGLAFFLENIDPAVRTVGDVQTLTSLPVVGRIPSFRARAQGRNRLLLHGSGSDGKAAAAFRRLRAGLLPIIGRNHLHTLLVTSAEPGAGKTTIAANLAVALAETGKQVILVDADLSHPSLQQLFAVPHGPGLAEVINNPPLLALNLVPTEIAGLRLLRSGTPTSDAETLLSGPEVPSVVRELAQRADLVLWDSPPVGASASTSLLAPLVDGVLLVVRQDGTRVEALHRSAEELSQVGATTFGVIFNRSGENAATYGPRTAAGAQTETDVLQTPPIHHRQKEVVRAKSGSGNSNGNGQVETIDHDSAL